MQMLIDFLPLLLAFAVYKAKGIYAATIALMIVLPLIPLGQKLLGKPVSKVHAWSAVLVIVFGTATLLFRNPIFIKVKPSVLYGAMAIAFYAVQRFSDTNLLQRALNTTIQLSDEHWRQLNNAYIGFFSILAALNLVVAYQFDEATWFSFKVWGLTGLLLVFVIAQSLWLAPRIIEPSDDPSTGDS